MKPNTNMQTIFMEIIQEQSAIVGEDLAYHSASLAGITINSSENNIVLKKEPKETLTDLIKAYENIFGRASVEVCLNVIRRHTKDEIYGLLPEKYLASF